jgi:UDP-N-acetylglucosamine 2-epimerase (non-hydrolysing)
MKVLSILGTRPEAIKMAPVIRALGEKRNVHPITLFSGQHKDIVHPILEWFEIEIDDSISFLGDDRSLSVLTGFLFRELELAVLRHQPDIMLAQGDTTTAMVAAVVAFYTGVHFGHVEAGLRTGNFQAPFPEEFNRVVAGKVARWHFCPTVGARDNLLREGVDSATIFITGNTVIDALDYTTKRLSAFARGVEKCRHILVTIHRRENFGLPLISICRAVKRLRDAFPDALFTLPVHPNPQVRGTVERELADQERIMLVQPLAYPALVEQMMRSYFVITDSGGIQEEAPFLQKPVLVLRHVTERPEAVELGLARLVGTDEENIFQSGMELLSNTLVYQRMAYGGSPYGDGRAANRICAALGLMNSSRFDAYA